MTPTILLNQSAPTLTPLVLIPGIGMILVAAFFVNYTLRRGGTWGYLGMGALAWMVTVVIKFMIAIAINQNIYNALYVPGQLFAPGSMLFYLYVGALTGLTEVLLTWLLLRYTRLGRASWNKALAFGIGFGAFEAALLGLSSLAGMLTGLLAPQSLPAAAMAGLAQANNPLFDLAPIIERIATIFCHILANVLLFYTVLTGEIRWLWVSFLYKTLLDTVAAFAQVWGVGSLAHIWVIEAFIILFGIIGVWGIRAIALRYPTRRLVEQFVETP